MLPTFLRMALALGPASQGSDLQVRRQTSVNLIGQDCRDIIANSTPLSIRRESRAPNCAACHRRREATGSRKDPVACQQRMAWALIDFIPSSVRVQRMRIECALDTLR